MFVVVVSFVLVPEKKEAFRKAMINNAALSLKQEPECHQFDVCFSADGERCFLYEIYTDEAAFNFHLKTPHFTEFNALSTEMVKSKHIDTYFLETDPELKPKRKF
jgi:(4S)-4-hydroxy-5-phosphonooxypentane-2,3-dione isomerase